MNSNAVNATSNAYGHPLIHAVTHSAATHLPFTGIDVVEILWISGLVILAGVIGLLWVAKTEKQN